ncbi:MAG: hypothetical protein MHM6MM_009523 [Cercozoa sp. M6MM]
MGTLAPPLSDSVRLLCARVLRVAPVDDVALHTHNEVVVNAAVRLSGEASCAGAVATSLSQRLWPLKDAADVFRRQALPQQYARSELRLLRALVLACHNNNNSDNNNNNNNNNEEDLRAEATSRVVRAATVLAVTALCCRPGGCEEVRLATQLLADTVSANSAGLRDGLAPVTQALLSVVSRASPTLLHAHAALLHW